MARGSNLRTGMQMFLPQPKAQKAHRQRANKTKSSVHRALASTLQHLTLDTCSRDPSILWQSNRGWSAQLSPAGVYCDAAGATSVILCLSDQRGQNAAACPQSCVDRVREPHHGMSVSAGGHEKIQTQSTQCRNDAVGPQFFCCLLQQARPCMQHQVVHCDD